MEEMVSVTSQWAHVSRDLYHLEPLPDAGSHSAMLRHACRSLLRHDDRLLRLSVAARYVSTMCVLAERAAALLREGRTDPAIGHPSIPVRFSQRRHRQVPVLTGRSAAV
jgi:hypothetical protein